MSGKVNKKLTKRAVIDCLRVLMFFLDDAIILLLIVLLLRFLGIQIPLPITIVVAVVAGTVVFIIHKVVMPDFRRRPLTGPEGMIGTQGRVVKTLSPIGTIIVGGEYWRAKSANGSIGVGENVEIVGFDGLTLKIKRKER